MNSRKEPIFGAPNPSIKAVAKAIDEVLVEPTSTGVTTSLPPEEELDFVRLADKVADGMNQAAQNALNEAQNLVNRVDLLSTQLRDHVRKIGHEITSLNGRIKDLGGGVVGSYDKFNLKPKESPPND